MHATARLFTICLVTTLATVSAQERAATPLAQLKVQQGIVVVLGSHDPNLPLQLAKSSQLTIYVQAAEAKTISSTRQRARKRTQSTPGRRPRPSGVVVLLSL